MANPDAAPQGSDSRTHRRPAPLIYNQFLEPFVYLDRESSTLLPYIQTTVGQFSTNFQVIYAAILASIIPLLVIYIAFRKAFVKGALAGAVKG